MGLSNPSSAATRCCTCAAPAARDRLKLKSLGGQGHGRTLLGDRRGTLWSTALDAKRAYVTVIAGTSPRQKIVSVAR